MLISKSSSLVLSTIIHPLSKVFGISALVLPFSSHFDNFYCGYFETLGPEHLKSLLWGFSRWI